MQLPGSGIGIGGRAVSGWSSVAASTRSVRLVLDGQRFFGFCGVGPVPATRHGLAVSITVTVGLVSSWWA